MKPLANAWLTQRPTVQWPGKRNQFSELAWILVTSTASHDALSLTPVSFIRIGQKHFEGVPEAAVTDLWQNMFIGYGRYRVRILVPQSPWVHLFFTNRYMHLFWFSQAFRICDA